MVVQGRAAPDRAGQDLIGPDRAHTDLPAGSNGAGRPHGKNQSRSIPGMGSGYNYRRAQLRNLVKVILGKKGRSLWDAVI